MEKDTSRFFTSAKERGLATVAASVVAGGPIGMPWQIQLGILALGALQIGSQFLLDRERIRAGRVGTEGGKQC